MSVTLAVNTEINALTQYLDYGFNSSALHDDGVLIARDDGLFLVGGSTDDGEIIEGGFNLPENDFTSSNQKHVRSLDLSYASMGEVAIQVSFDDKIGYEVVAPSTEGLEANAKLDGRRDCYGRNLGIEITNVDGCFFTVYDLSGFIIQSIRRTR